MNIMIQGLSVTVIGLAIVMIVLYLLSILLGLLKYIGAKPQAPAAKAEVTERIVEVEAEAPPAAVTDDLETVAVITAALAAYLGTAPDGLIVRSIRKVSAWNDTVRKEHQRRLS